MTAEKLADLSFLECNELQVGFKETLINGFDRQESKQKALEFYKETEISLHGKLAEIIRGLLSNPQ